MRGPAWTSSLRGPHTAHGPSWVQVARSRRILARSACSQGPVTAESQATQRFEGPPGPARGRPEPVKRALIAEVGMRVSQHRGQVENPGLATPVRRTAAADPARPGRVGPSTGRTGRPNRSIRCASATPRARPRAACSRGTAGRRTQPGLRAVSGPREQRAYALSGMYVANRGAVGAWTRRGMRGPRELHDLIERPSGAVTRTPK
jgi:hypothetical protein